MVLSPTTIDPWLWLFLFIRPFIIKLIYSELDFTISLTIKITTSTGIHLILINISWYYTWFRLLVSNKGHRYITIMESGLTILQIIISCSLASFVAGHHFNY